VRYFEGTPIPTSLLLVALLFGLTWAGLTGDHLPGGSLQLGQAIFHPVVLLFALSGSAMISKTLRIPKP
jgi:CDP-diacylglycerol--serine O-phosphatidyltransferase